MIHLPVKSCVISIDLNRSLALDTYVVQSVQLIEGFLECGRILNLYHTRENFWVTIQMLSESQELKHPSFKYTNIVTDDDLPSNFLGSAEANSFSLFSFVN